MYNKEKATDKLMFVDKLTRTKWREPFLVGRRLGAAENVRFIGCYGGSKPPPYGFVRQSNSPLNQNLKSINWRLSVCYIRVLEKRGKTKRKLKTRQSPSHFRFFEFARRTDRAERTKPKRMLAFGAVSFVPRWRRNPKVCPSKMTHPLAKPISKSFAELF